MSTDPALPETERKLREARFFLDYIRAEERKSLRPEPEAHGFYLSAFLSAGRSVTFVLQKEVGGEEHYRPWSDKWMSSRSEEERRLLKFMNDQRVAEVHNVGSDTTHETARVPMPLVDMGGVRPHPAYSSSWFALFGTSPPTMGVMTHSAYVTSKDVTVHLGQDRAADVVHTITLADGTTRLASDVARDACDAWDLILRARGLLS